MYDVRSLFSQHVFWKDETFYDILPTAAEEFSY